MVDNFAVWCEQNHLQFNVAKTKELLIDMRATRTPVAKSEQPMIMMFHELVTIAVVTCYCQYWTASIANAE